MKKITIIVALHCFLSFTLIAQNGINSGAANFLDINPSPASVSLGGVGTAVQSGIFSSLNNPALAVFEKGIGGIGYSYTPWMKQYDAKTLHSAALSWKIGDKGRISGGFRHFSHQNGTHISDANGNITDSFSPKEWSAEVGYSMSLSANFSAGLTARWINSNMGSYDALKRGGTLAVDLGVLYHTNIASMSDSKLSFGLMASNLGGKISYSENGAENDLPSKIKVGGSLDVFLSEEHSVLLAIDAGYRLLPSDISSIETGLGVQYAFKNMIMIRGGYHIGDKEKSYGSYASIGLGVDIFDIKCDFSYLLASKPSVLNNIWQIAIGFNFGIFSKKSQ